MLSIAQKQAILDTIQHHLRHDTDNERILRQIIDEVTKDLARHKIALQRARDRNTAKASRRTQRGPTI